MRCVAGLLWLLALLCLAQQRISVQELVSFVRSSIQLRHPDRQVAEYLKKVTLSERLEDSVIQQLRAFGAGPRTLEALQALRDSSRDLPPPAAAAPKPAPPPPPAPAEQGRIIEEVRQYAMNYVRGLPDFICTQVTRRYVDPTGLEFWTQQDVITARLTYFEQREDYKVVLINNRPANVSYDRLEGATSTGEFGSLMRELFAPETQARFRWERWATLRGRRTHVYSYFVEQPRSHWRISYQKTLEITPGYRGLVYVDADTLAVARITLEAVGIPPDFPIQEASTVLDYDYVEIAGRKYWLPLRAVVRMREGKLLLRNEVEFRMYRKFAAEATITFETPEPLPEDKIKEQPPK
ncbi:MAG: hypothetical protein ACP5U2_13685 [Bryobacteraceae bacterium]